MSYGTQRLQLGEILVNSGVLTKAQADAVLARQLEVARPFGEIAEHMFGVSARAVEAAWAEQYSQITRWIDPTSESVDPSVRELVNRRQAWQFRLLPMGYDGAELMVCTTKDGLVRAMNFAGRQLPLMCFFVLSEPEHLAQALQTHYPMDGMGLHTLVAPAGGENGWTPRPA